MEAGVSSQIGHRRRHPAFMVCDFPGPPGMMTFDPKHGSGGL
ncbi:hypothetical protein [Azospirillum largimobile]